METYASNCKYKILEGISEKVRELSESLDEKKWHDICDSYEFEDIEDILKERNVSINLKLVKEALIYASLEDFYNADINFNEALKKISVGPPTTIKEKEYFAYAKAYVHFLFGTERFFHAENVLKHEVRIDKFNARGKRDFLELYFLLGLSLLKQKKFFEAKDAFLIYKDSLMGLKQNKIEDLSEFDFNLSKSHRYLASTYYGIGTEFSISKAKTEFEMAKKASPESFHAAISANNLSNILYNEFQKNQYYPTLVDSIREINEGLRILEKLKKSIKRNFNYYHSVLLDTRALVKMGYGDYDGAEVDLKEALLQQKSENIPPSAVKFHLGYLYELKEKPKQAKIQYQESINTLGCKKTQTRYVSKAYAAKGLLSQKEKNFDEAKKCFGLATDIDPQNQEAKQYLQNLEVTRDKTTDWWDWWSQTNSKKIVLGGLVSIIIVLWFLPYANDNVVDIEEKFSSPANYTQTITKKFTPPEANLGVIAILIAIILLPSVSKIKAGMIELDTREMKTSEEGDVVQTPLLM